MPGTAHGCRLRPDCRRRRLWADLLLIVEGGVKERPHPLQVRAVGAQPRSHALALVGDGALAVQALEGACRMNTPTVDKLTLASIPVK